MASLGAQGAAFASRRFGNGAALNSLPSVFGKFRGVKPTAQVRGFKTLPQDGQFASPNVGGGGNNLFGTPASAAQLNTLLGRQGVTNLEASGVNNFGNIAAEANLPNHLFNQQQFTTARALDSSPKVKLAFPKRKNGVVFENTAAQRRQQQLQLFNPGQAEGAAPSNANGFVVDGINDLGLVPRGSNPVYAAYQPRGGGNAGARARIQQLPAIGQQQQQQAENFGRRAGGFLELPAPQVQQQQQRINPIVPLLIAAPIAGGIPQDNNAAPFLEPPVNNQIPNAPPIAGLNNGNKYRRNNSSFDDAVRMNYSKLQLNKNRPAQAPVQQERPFALAQQQQQQQVAAPAPIARDSNESVQSASYLYGSGEKASDFGLKRGFSNIPKKNIFLTLGSLGAVIGSSVLLFNESLLFPASAKNSAATTDTADDSIKTPSTDDAPASNQTTRKVVQIILWLVFTAAILSTIYFGFQSYRRYSGYDGDNKKKSTENANRNDAPVLIQSVNNRNNNPF